MPPLQVWVILAITKKILTHIKIQDPTSWNIVILKLQDLPIPVKVKNKLFQGLIFETIRILKSKRPQVIETWPWGLVYFNWLKVSSFYN